MFFHLFYLVFLFSFSGEATEVLADKFGWLLFGHWRIKNESHQLEI